MTNVDRALWVGLGGLVAATAVYFSFRQQERNTWHIILTLLALLLPVLLSRPLQLRQWAGELPPALDIALGAIVGVSLWGISWWVMSVANDQLYAQIGLYDPPFAYLDSWAWQVIYFVVLLPLAAAWLVFGRMRSPLEALPFPLAWGFLTLYFAVLTTIITPQGLVSFLGYGLLGGVAAFLSLQTRSFWLGFAPVMGFMYANLAFLDNLGAELGGIAYTEIPWLSFLAGSAFLSLVFIQVIRFRQPPSTPAPPSHRPTAIGYAAFVGLLVILVLVAAGELQRRNISTAALDEFLIL